ncbi:MAG: hypothetical protein IKZ12_04880 [Alistipes sp.]|nr:hypothetical protein [Alistipes sp.]
MFFVRLMSNHGLPESRPSAAVKLPLSQTMAGVVDLFFSRSLSQSRNAVPLLKWWVFSAVAPAPPVVAAP